MNPGSVVEGEAEIDFGEINSQTNSILLNLLICPAENLSFF